MKKIFKVFIISLAFSLISSVCYAAADTSEAALQILNEKRIILGDEYGNIMNTSPISREQMVCVLGRILGIDKTEGEVHVNDAYEISDWAVPSVAYGYEKGFIDGYPDNCFKPKKVMNYEEAIKFVLCAYQTVIKSEKELNIFKDTHEYPDSYIDYAKQTGILDGVSGNKGTPITREDSFTLIYNVFKAEIVKGTKSEPSEEETYDNPQEPSKDTSVSEENKKDIEIISAKEAYNIVVEKMGLTTDEGSNGGDTPDLSAGEECDYNGERAYKFELSFDDKQIGAYYYIINSGVIEYVTE